MEQECNLVDTAPFSYEILDKEAAKTTALVQAVQERCIQGGEHLALDLFEWAEQLHLSGRRAEAELLYLHAINRCERTGAAVYPMVFTGLRDFARLVIERASRSGLEPPAVASTFEAAA